jgi:hypothetical protein
LKKRIKVTIKQADEHLPIVHNLRNPSENRNKRLISPSTNLVQQRGPIESTFVTGFSPDNIPRTTDAPSRIKWQNNVPTPRDTKQFVSPGKHSMSQISIEDIVQKKHKLERMLEQKHHLYCERESMLEER